MIRLVALKRACWVWWHRACYLELVYLVTAFVPSNMACLVSSPGRSSLDHPGGDAGLGIGGDLLRHLVDVDSFWASGHLGIILGKSSGNFFLRQLDGCDDYRVLNSTDEIVNRSALFIP